MTRFMWNILILSFSFLVSAQEAKKCSAPPAYPHTRLPEEYVHKREFNIGDKVYYNCEEDFAPSSSRSPRAVQCVDTGEWTRLALKCEKKRCPYAGELLNGEYIYEGNSYIGEKVYAKCNEGYTLKGLGYRICKKSVWTGEIPTCEEGEATCSTPEVANSVSSGREVSVHQVGDTVKLTCSQGFQLDGAQQITCGSDGQWQPQPPLCLPEKPQPTPEKPQETPEKPQETPQRTFEKPQTPQRTPERPQETPQRTFEKPQTPQRTPEKPQEMPERTFEKPQRTPQRRPQTPHHSPNKGGRCGVPDTGKKPHVRLADEYITKTSFASGEKVLYACATGYIPARGSRSRKCVNGRWMSLQLRCQRKPCGSAGEILNGQFHYTGVEFGDTAKAVCDEGFILVGTPTRRCMSQGWDGRVPVCEAVDCGEPPEVVNAEVIGQWEPPFVYRTVVEYQCKVGVLAGLKEVWCTSDGTWSAAPTCQEMVMCPAPRIKWASWAGSHNKQYPLRTTLSVECYPGFIRHGPSDITCERDGLWSPRLPMCTRSPRSYWRHY